jgi:HEAT repeat protein
MKTALLLVLTGALAGEMRDRRDEAPAPADLRMLREAGLGTDGVALLEYFRQQTLADSELEKLQQWISDLGSDSFVEREQASRELIKRGRPALPFLQRVLESSDLEVRRRARLCLRAVEQGSGVALARAAARLLAVYHPPGTEKVLLAYLPFADDRSVVEEVLQTLLEVTPPGKVHPAVLAAVKAPVAVVREAAVHVLAQKGSDEQRQRVKPLLNDPDPQVRLRAAQMFLRRADPTAVDTLLALLDRAPLEVAWQAEDVLRRLAGEEGPTESVGNPAPDARKRCRAAWQTWWTRNRATVDLTRYVREPALLGLTLCVEYNTNRVWECGRDGKPRWEILGLAGPMDCQVLASGHILLVEANNRKVTERDRKGKIHWEVTIPGRPNGCRRLPNGNTFVSTSNSAMEFDRAAEQVYLVNFKTTSNAVCKYRGHILFATNNEIVEMDTTGRKIRSIAIPRAGHYSCIQGLPGGRYLVSNNSSNQILEVDRAGKILWKKNFTGACGIHRLPNGNTLVSTRSVAAELNREGKQVWQARTSGYIRRVHRR